jgi:hypothetical protein
MPKRYQNTEKKKLKTNKKVRSIKHMIWRSMYATQRDIYVKKLLICLNKALKDIISTELNEI